MFDVVKKEDLKPGTKVIDSSWACKKKSNGTLRGRLNARGFKQIDVQRYDGSSLHAPVTNGATIRIALTLMLMGDISAEVMNVKEALLKGDIEDGEEIRMKVPQGWEHHYVQ